MDIVQKNTSTPRPADPERGETGRILMFPQRPPRLAMVDWGSGWYHQAAIDEPLRPAAPKR